MGKVEELAEKYSDQITIPWSKSLAGAQRVLIVVYEKETERYLRSRIDEFAQRTQAAGHTWAQIDATDWFAQWMAEDEYREEYFEDPEFLSMKLDGEFSSYIAGRLMDFIKKQDENTVIALTGTASLYGFARVSQLVDAVEKIIPGRLVVFFPGTKDANIYRLLDARDGWNYLASSITLHNERGTA